LFVALLAVIAFLFVLGNFSPFFKEMNDFNLGVYEKKILMRKNMQLNALFKI